METTQNLSVKDSLPNRGIDEIYNLRYDVYVSDWTIFFDDNIERTGPRYFIHSFPTLEEARSFVSGCIIFPFEAQFFTIYDTLNHCVV